MYFVLGGAGFVGSAVCRHLAARGVPHVAIRRDNYAEWVGRPCSVLVNCTGNARRYWASDHPYGDFAATVETTARSLFDFPVDLYVQISSVDVYERTDDPRENAEETAIRPERLTPYGFHKWLAESLVRRYAPSWLILRLGGLVGDGLKKNAIFDALSGAPLRLTPDSELGFIDTAVVASAIERLVSLGIRDQLYNVCGTGILRMDELARLSPLPVRFAADGERQTYRINNEKLRILMPIPSSIDAVAAFLQRAAVKQAR